MTSEQVNKLKRMVAEDNQSYVAMNIEPHCYMHHENWYCHFYLPAYDVLDEDEFERIVKYAKEVNGHWQLGVMNAGIWGENPKPYFTIDSW